MSFLNGLHPKSKFLAFKVFAISEDFAEDLRVTPARSTGQTLLSVAVSTDMLGAIDAKRGAATRSAFVRECLAEYLELPVAYAAAPDRTGKGGKPKALAITKLPTPKNKRSA